MEPQDLNGIDTPLPGDEIPEYPAFSEAGLTGLRRAAGYVDEEFLPQLRGRKAVQVFREMADNEPVVGALLFAIDRLLRNSIACFIAILAWHITRPRLVDIGKASRIGSIEDGGTC
jgi:hypothetical protein